MRTDVIAQKKKICCWHIAGRNNKLDNIIKTEKISEG